MTVEPVFDEVIHPANRLQICAILAAADAVEFRIVRDAMSVSDSVLSKQIKVLDEAGYVTISKLPKGSRVRTWLELTVSGRAALDGHLAKLRRITEIAEGLRPQQY
ncbi:transcriptional regulator [Nocardia sp. KC 131]|uniref:transcriptional regulator n=1 Tax=Nocardia arseniciresistens TaxID=3392119 RepID=UPI00398F6453